MVTNAANPFAVDPGDDLPVGLQLTLRLRALISTGQLRDGERLPSVRRLADWAGVNLNTVRAVYGQLEGDGLVTSRQGQGTFVAAGVEAAPQLERIAVEALRSASAAGLDARELADVVLACASIPGGLGAPPEDPPAAAPDPTEEAEAIEVRRELRRQIGRIEAELGAYARDLPADLPTATPRAVAHVAGVEELEQTRDTLVAQLSEARRSAERRARDEARQRVRKQRSGGTGDEGVGPLGRAMGWWRQKS